jgi:hypothetical protein
MHSAAFGFRSRPGYQRRRHASVEWGEDGYRSQAQVPGMQSLAVSGQVETTWLLAEARQCGYDFELLEKPVNPKQLLAKIRSETSPPETEVKASYSALAF